MILLRTVRIFSQVTPIPLRISPWFVRRSLAEECEGSLSSLFICLFQHPNYKPLTSDDVLVKNDIALIRLSKRIERAPILDWICLPTAVKVQDQSILKVVAYSNAEEHSVQQQLDVRVLDHPRTRSECQRQLTDIAEDAFCAISTRNSSSLGVVSDFCSIRGRQSSLLL